MRRIAAAALLMPSALTGAPSADPPTPVSSMRSQAPALAGVQPPAGTTLVHMDIFVAPHARGVPAVYRLRSPHDAATFLNRYKRNAKRAGYRVAMRHRSIVGVRVDGTSIRLHVLALNGGSTAVLTVTPPPDDRR